MRRALALRLLLLSGGVGIAVVSLILRAPQVLFIIATIGSAFYTVNLFVRRAPMSYRLSSLGAFAFMTYGALGSLGVIRSRDWLGAIIFGIILLLGALYADQSQYTRFKEAFREVRRRREKP